MTSGTRTGTGPGREPLRVIHVGVGTRGKSHVRASQESGYWRPVALVDIVPEYLAAARDFTQPLFVYGEQRLVRLGVEVLF